jgi:hypothetical protein
MKKEPGWLILFRLFALGSYPIVFLIQWLTPDFADSMELIFFAWFLVFLVVFPAYLVFEIIALVTVWRDAASAQLIGSNRIRSICLAVVACEAFAFWMTRVLAIGMRVG